MSTEDVKCVIGYFRSEIGNFKDMSIFSYIDEPMRFVIWSLTRDKRLYKDLISNADDYLKEGSNMGYCFDTLVQKAGYTYEDCAIIFVLFLQTVDRSILKEFRQFLNGYQCIGMREVEISPAPACFGVSDKPVWLPEILLERNILLLEYMDWVKRKCD